MTVIEVTADSCDACPADARVPAYVYAEHPDWTSTLAYCSHHGTQYLPELTASGAKIIDLRHRLTR